MRHNNITDTITFVDAKYDFPKKKNYNYKTKRKKIKSKSCIKLFVSITIHD